MSNDQISKLVERFIHDIISDVNGIKLCIDAQEIEMASASASNILNRAQIHRSIITNKNTLSKYVPDKSLIEELHIPLALIVMECMDCKIVKEENKIILMSHGFINQDSILINIARSMMQYELCIKEKSQY